MIFEANGINPPLLTKILIGISVLLEKVSIYIFYIFDFNSTSLLSNQIQPKSKIY